LNEAKLLAKQQLTNGQALAKFRMMVERQGGDPELVDNPDRLPKAAIVESIFAERSGYIASIKAGAVGWSCVPLGAGRETKNAPIDHAVGMIIPVKVGDQINAGDLLGTVHANDEGKCLASLAQLEGAFSWSDEPVPELPLFYETISRA
jgi:pyrimidine-nucleoside phosphorylase